jgi:mono/diheme cytochrome c family protein
MSTIGLAAASVLVSLPALAAGIAPGDASRGEAVFRNEQCISCHSFQGKGGSTAPDLARRIDRNFTPAVMASAIWNHAPAMWEGMRKQGIVKSTLSAETAADLFAYFIAARYFEKPGDAARGKQAFSARHCAGCHGISTSPAAGGPPVVKWESLADPIVLAQQMWNHAGEMQKAFAAKKLKWAQLSAQELSDILVYLQNLPETRSLAANFAFPPSANGAALFESKGCARCHTGKMALETKLKNATMTEIAAGMWNHAPNMAQPAPKLEKEEMRQIVSHVWMGQYSNAGSPERGKRVFAEKGCAACHGATGKSAPALARGKGAYSEIVMTAAVWQHGPRMLDRMKERKQAWPRFTAPQMTDLIAYLNTL